MAHALPYVAFSCPLMQDRLHFDGQAHLSWPSCLAAVLLLATSRGILG